MQAETKQCQNCHNEFTIEPNDFAFYEKIKVPAPTWCSGCRFWRRLSYFNERHLYQNVCGICGKKVIAMYPEGTTFPVYCLDCYRGDGWDPLSYGEEYDFNRPFFEQFRELKNSVPRAERVMQGEPEGSSYCNRASYNKNCYFLVRANYNENSRYSYNLWEVKDSADCFNVHKSELVYESIDTVESYNVQYVQECRQCRDSIFLFDCRNCVECLGCVGLRNKQYHIFNKPYSKEEYKKEVEKMHLDTRTGRQAFAEHFQKFLKDAIRESATNTNCVGSTGNWLIDCKNVTNSFQSRKVEDSKNLLSVIEAKDCMDYSYWGRGVELIYETTNCGYDSYRIRFVNESWDACHDLTYCDNCYASANLFGCVGLRKKEYCIFNKQYTKEEYNKLVPKIIEQMKEMPYQDQQGRTYSFGEFFPPEFSTSAYNTTLAYEYFPLNEQETVKKGLIWENAQEKAHAPSMNSGDLPESIGEITDDILKETISCTAYDEQGAQATKEHNCTKAFKITAEELAFYKRLNIPLPKECPNTRHFRRFQKRNPLKLWHRTCMCNKTHQHHSGACSNEFETSYPPDRPEIVYCEQCYQQEVA